MLHDWKEWLAACDEESSVSRLTKETFLSWIQINDEYS